jgi:hypothetical protein
MLRKAVSKLVDNSVKFTEAGTVTLGFELINNEIELFVKDTGKGIEKDAQEHVYKYFRQEEVSRTRGYEGNGLGLSIAKGLMQLLGGDIRLESTKKVGTTVFLTLPTITSTVSSKPKNLANAIKTEGMPIILIVEDDVYSEMILSRYVNKLSKEVLKARTGKEAVEVCRKNPGIDLILMDIQMPDLNGYEATRQIRQFNKNVVIIAQTAFALSSEEKKAIEAGCNDYIAKPINKDELLSLIQKYFGK